jgi:hypothetical protein
MRHLARDISQPKRTNSLLRHPPLRGAVDSFDVFVRSELSHMMNSWLVPRDGLARRCLQVDRPIVERQAGRPLAISAGCSNWHPCVVL